MDSVKQQSSSSPKRSESIDIHLVYNHRKLLIKCEAGTSYDEVSSILFDKINKHHMQNKINNHNQIIGFTHRPANLVLDYLLSIKKGELSASVTLTPFFKNKHQGLLKYQLYKCLAVGGFSKVYLVRSHANGEFYVMKVISKIQKQNHDPDLSVIYNQKQINSSLGSHPFIVNFIEEFQTQKFAFFILEYCPGGELFYNLKKIKRMDQNEARFYFIEILFAFQHLHQKGILYRDLKPENIFIGVDGHIKLGDFGLSRMGMDQETLTYSFCGSAEYMAPEMILRTGHSFLFDFYTLGAMLYELVVGIPPFYSHDEEQNRHSILNQQVNFPDDISLSEDLKNFLTGLLNKNPKLRLGCLKGTKQIKFHPWVGMVNSKRVLKKQLLPPFLPCLDDLNFDQNQIGNDQQQFTTLLKRQIKQLKQYQTDSHKNKSVSKLLRNYSNFKQKSSLFINQHTSSHKILSPYLQKMSLFKTSKLSIIHNHQSLSKQKSQIFKQTKLPDINKENKTLDINKLTKQYIQNMSKKRNPRLFINSSLQSKDSSSIKHKHLDSKMKKGGWKNNIIRLEMAEALKTKSVWQ